MTNTHTKRRLEVLKAVNIKTPSSELRQCFIDGLVEGTVSKVMTGECLKFRHEGGISSHLLSLYIIILYKTSISLSNLSLSLLYSIRSFLISSSNLIYSFFPLMYCFLFDSFYLCFLHCISASDRNNSLHRTESFMRHQNRLKQLPNF
jgi:hypothetical protein